jgi:hypothetical protein
MVDDDEVKDKKRAVQDAELLAEIGKLRIEIAEKEVQERTLGRELVQLKSKLRTALIRANQFLVAEITALGPDEEEIAKKKAMIATTTSTSLKSKPHTGMYGPKAKTKLDMMGTNVIYKEVVIELGNYIRTITATGKIASRVEIRKYISESFGVENTDSLGTSIGQYLRYMIAGKHVARVNKGEYKWVGKPLSGDDGYKPKIDNVVELTK